MDDIKISVKGTIFGIEKRTNGINVSVLDVIVSVVKGTNEVFLTNYMNVWIEKNKESLSVYYSSLDKFKDFYNHAFSILDKDTSFLLIKSKTPDFNGEVYINNKSLGMIPVGVEVVQNKPFNLKL